MLESLLEAYVSGLAQFWSTALRVHVPNVVLLLLLWWWFCGRRRYRKWGCCGRRCRCTCGGCCCDRHGRHRGHDHEGDHDMEDEAAD